MKSLLSIFLAALVFSPLAAAPVEEGESRKLLDSQAELLSARLLFDEAQKRWFAATLPAADPLADEMMKKRSECVSRAGAGQLMQPFYLELLQTDYNEMAERTLSPFRETLPKETLEQLRKVPLPQLMRKRDRDFSKVFSDARKKVFEMQFQEMEQYRYPTEAELDSDNDEALTAKLQARMAKGRLIPFCEEITENLADRGIPLILKEGRQQQQKQLAFATQLLPNRGIWDAKAAEADIERKLNTEIKSWLGKQYALFPRSRAIIQQRSTRLPQEWVIALLPRIVPAPDYGTVLAENPAANADPAKSLQNYAVRVTDMMLAAAENQAEIPAALRAGIPEDAGVGKALERRFDALKPALQKQRDAFARQQLTEQFPALPLPAPEAVEAFRKDPAQPPPLPAGADNPALLAETRKLLASSMLEQLKAGNAELTAQLDAVDAEYDSVVAEMEKTRDNNNPSWLARWFGAKAGVDLDAIRQSYTSRVLAAHNKIADRKYPELFPLTVTETDLRARAILQRLNSPAQPSAQKPETPPVEPPPAPVTFRITISADGKMLSVRLKGKQFSASMDPAVREADEKRVIAEVAGELAILSAAATQGKPIPPPLIVSIEVGKGAIYYHFVAELREALKDDGTTIEDGLKP